MNKKIDDKKLKKIILSGKKLTESEVKIIKNRIGEFKNIYFIKRSSNV